MFLPLAGKNVKGVKKMLKVVMWLLGFLPDSWFAAPEATEQISEYISYMNFFIPFDQAISATTAWLACIVVYFAYSWGMNFISAIKELM